MASATDNDNLPATTQALGMWPSARCMRSIQNIGNLASKQSRAFADARGSRRGESHDAVFLIRRSRMMNCSRTYNRLLMIIWPPHNVYQQVSCLVELVSE